MSEILEMLRESNAIEGVYDRPALVSAHRAWKYIIAQDKLTNNVIKETHRLMMVGIPMSAKYRGDWRDVPVSIGGVIKSQPKIVIDSQMRDFCEEVSRLDPDTDPLQDHLKFESIHPLIDGNGRIGRIILNWQATKLGQPLYVFLESEKYEKYYTLFRNDK